ncbi:MAG: hypothetical protein K9W44_08435 [Candidatus Lokiarchaeota archaeon]|nr:hypothetical protein [Candidatus Harpocratesius repetitus]
MSYKVKFTTNLKEKIHPIGKNLLESIKKESNNALNYISFIEKIYDDLLNARHQK